MSLACLMKLAVQPEAVVAALMAVGLRAPDVERFNPPDTLHEKQNLCHLVSIADRYFEIQDQVGINPPYLNVTHVFYLPFDGGPSIIQRMNTPHWFVQISAQSKLTEHLEETAGFLTGDVGISEFFEIQSSDGWTNQGPIKGTKIIRRGDNE